MTNDAPHSAPTPLSRFLGGWMRHPSPQEPEQVTDDAEAAEAAASSAFAFAVVEDAWPFVGDVGKPPSAELRLSSVVPLAVAVDLSLGTSLPFAAVVSVVVAALPRVSPDGLS